MRFSALIPVAFTATSLVLTFLCLFAGSKKGFMEDYAVVTLNTSRIGENVLNTSSSSGGNIFTSFLHNLTNTIEGDINNDLNSLAQELGLHDFYSVHLLDYCEGFYTPTAVPNATFPGKDIKQNVTGCSNTSALYTFDPQITLQKELNASGHSNINLTDLHWPSSVNSGLSALRVAQRAAFVLYCIAIAFIFIALCLALLSVFFDGRLSAFINVLVDWLAFIAVGLASAITTAVAVKASDVINKYGKDVGISANKGDKFLVLTWVATGLMLVASFVWCGECIVGRRKNRYRATEYTDGTKY